MSIKNLTIPVFDHSAQPNAQGMPVWIRQKLGGNQQYSNTAKTIQQGSLNTVCEEARCPNRGECWNRGTATFMLLGETCTRACGFCAVKTGQPEWFDDDEPRRIAEAVNNMALEYVVLTSVNRDDMKDGGAAIYAQTLKLLRQQKPNIGLEILTPDFRQDQNEAIETISQAAYNTPFTGNGSKLIWGHNVETVPSLYKVVRKGSKYERSLKLLELAAVQTDIEAKSSLMLGLGESRDEVLEVMRDLRAVGTHRLSLGQYLRPTKFHLPVQEYLTPEQFDEYADEAHAMGFSWVKSGPLVRSSYHAEEEQN